MTEVVDQVPAPINIFYSYAPEDQPLSRELDTHLALLERQGIISRWDHSRINVGTEELQESMERLNSAHIILLLISRDFVASDNCYKIEMPRALARHDAGEAQAIAIILRAVHYDQNAPFAKLQILPPDGVPVVSGKWPNHDEAWTEVVKEILKVITSLSNTSQLPPNSPDEANASSKKKLLHFWLELISRHPRIFITVVMAIIAVIAVIAVAVILNFFLQNNHSIIPSNTINTQSLSLQSVTVGDEPLDNIGIITDLNVINPPTASERCIYNENATIHKPFIVVFAVTTLGATNNDLNNSSQIGDEELQGLCQWQQKYSSQIPLKIFIANIGTKETNVLNVTVPKVTQQIIDFANTNENFAGVVGFSFSSSLTSSVQGAMAMQKLNDAHIPVISPAASSSDFSNTWPYFYRVIPNNKTEGQDAADYALNSLNAKSAYVISDPGNPYSKTLGQAFTQQFFDEGHKHVTPITYTVGQSSDSFKSIAKSIASNIPTNPGNPIVIFCSCYADDLSNLLNVLPQKVDPNIIIMGGEALYELGGYENNYANIYFTAFAYPDTGTIESLCQGHCTDEQKGFSTMYCLSRGTPHANCDGKIYGVSRPGPHTIQMYDALNALIQAYKNTSEGNRTREKLRDALSTLKFEGISGWIDFNNAQSQSDPKNKIVLVVCVNSNSHAHLVYRYGQFIDPTLVSSGVNATIDSCQDK